MLHTDLEKQGYIEVGEVREVIDDIIRYASADIGDLMDVYLEGAKVILTDKGLVFSNREKSGMLRATEGVNTVVEVLTVEELHAFIKEHKEFIDSGKGYVVRKIMEYKLRQKLDDVYMDNTDTIMKRFNHIGYKDARLTTPRAM